MIEDPDEKTKQGLVKGKIIACSVCGKKMTVPPQYQNTPGKCPVCGSIVNANAGASSEALRSSSPLDDLYEPAKPVSAAVPAKPQKEKEPVGRAILWSLLFMALGAIIGGVIFATAMYLAGATGKFFSLKAFIASSGTGATVGSIIAGTWFFIRRLSLNLIADTLVATAIGLASSTFFYMLEWVLITKPDKPLWQAWIVGLFAGFIAGIFLSNLIASEEL